MRTTIMTISRRLLLPLFFSHLLLFSFNNYNVQALVTGASRRRISSSTSSSSSRTSPKKMGNLIGEMVAKSVAASASTSRSLPFPLPLPGRPRSLDFRENRKRMVSLVAMGLTKMLASNTATLDAPALAPAAATAPKLLNLSNEELADIIKKDSRERQFLCTADFSRAIYDDCATFKDGSDIDGSYPMNAWIRGCKLLFDAQQSQCKILEHTMVATKHHVQFRFAETLTFRTMLQPRVYLTGTVFMKRDAKTGLIVSYEEQWDQDMNEIIRRTKLTL